MNDRKKTLLNLTRIIGIICLLWIVLDIALIQTDLEAVIRFQLQGKIIGIGYILLLIFHGLAVILYFSCFGGLQNPGWNGFYIVAGIMSTLCLAVQKVMFDEVGREFTMEQPIPGETYFIYLALLINALFILYVRIWINKFKKSDMDNGSTKP